MSGRPATSGHPRPTLISAHRGGVEDAPLASWEAYLASADTAADYVEVDVRRTSDGELVAHHDPYPEAVPGRPLVRELSYRRLCELTGRRVPRIPEVLDLIAGRARVQLDLKEIGYERRVIDLAHDRLGRGNVLVSTLEPESVRAVKRDFDDVPAGLILGRELSGSARLRWPVVRWRELRPLRRVRRCGADWVVTHHALARAGVLRLCAREGIPVAVWTVNADRMIDRMLSDNRVAMLITDRPRFVAGRRAAINP
ncbi:MAG TPA: glycerophosphodiester phosphodiesterase [Micromonosporaceae bacterium]|jgi:glycerophosphoryl diester phosphodiesterase|nr:glycerophosphodiester phosphodiesterase [Micromonosporaceae bacterium]